MAKSGQSQTIGVELLIMNYGLKNNIDSKKDTDVDVINIIDEDDDFDFSI